MSRVLRQTPICSTRWQAFYKTRFGLQFRFPTMRLLDATTRRLVEFVAHIPPYTILSHCWGTDEVTFEDVYHLSDTEAAIERKAGWQKIRKCCEKSLREGFRYVWIDTCCINKSSSAELSEAINSMFRWYADATVCFAYLADVPNMSDEEALFRSRWFTRGWTLQELISPREVIFFDASWCSSTTRRLVANKIHRFIGIDAAILLHSRPLRSYSVAQRFSWAARRKTTRLEDQAYSLLGLFGVHMPLLYGEGNNAFLRLQEEILRVDQDLSILAWSIPQHTDWNDFDRSVLPLAPSLSFFSHCDNIISAMSSKQQQSDSPDTVVTAHSVRLTTTVIKVPAIKPGASEIIVAVLNCRYAEDITRLIAIEIRPIAPFSDTTLMQNSEILKVRSNNQAFFLHDRIRMVDAFDVMNFGVAKTILIERLRPWFGSSIFRRELVYSHLWLRFDERLLNERWVTQGVIPEEHWMTQQRTLDLDAVFAKQRQSKGGSIDVKDLSPTIYAAIVMSDGDQNQIIIYLRMQSASLHHLKIDFRLDHFDSQFYAPSSVIFPDSADDMPQSIRLHDGTKFTVRRGEDVVTDKVIAHLAITLES